MSSLVDGRIERRLGVAIVAAASTVLKKVDESRSLSGSTRSTTAQLPSPLPSPPPATTQLSSSSSSALTPRRSASDHTTVLLTHSTPPQSPFMDDKPIIMRLNTGSNATMPAATTTTVTPDDDNQNSSSIINLIVDEPATSMTTSSMTPTASSTTTTTSTTQIGEPTSTTTIVDSSQHQQQQQAPHTPPESNDGTQSSTSEMKLNGEELARKLAHYNSLNAAFKNETLSARLESTRRRLRSIHSAVFNRHLATYLASNSTHSPDQMIGDEIAYEIARRREDDDEEDEDDDDDDDNMSLTSSSSSEQPDDDQLVYAAATPRENDSSTKNSTGDVHFVDNSELNLLNNLCADDYWSMQRVKLGSEWQRLQTKMAYLRRTNEQVNKYVRSEREIEKLSKSLKDSIRKTFSVSDEDVDTEEDRSLADHSSASSSDYSDQEEEDEETSRRVIGSSTTTNKRRSRQGGAGGGLKQVVRFDDEIVLKSFYVTLMNLRTGLFKEACVCGGETASRAPQVAATRLEATKSCIFCHMFKKYDGDLVDRAANRVLSLPTRDLSSSVDTTPQDQESNYSIRADERVIKLYHSYCKQPKYGEKLQWTRVPLEAANKRHKAQPLRPRNHVDDEMSVVVGDEYTDLSSLVNERLNRLFGCHSSRENRENENNSSHSGEQADKDKSQPPCSSNIVLKDDFDEIEIDPGYEISLDDIKKLPDFSYDELKFLCGDELWLEENDDEPKTKLSNSRKRKEQDEDEMARFDEQKRLRLDSNR